jgi:thiamine-phosphate pyrophosphorylase
LSVAIDFRLYVISDRRQTAGRPLVAALQAAAHAGVKAIQLREKDLAPRQLYALAQEVKGVLDPCGTQLFINDRSDVACAVRAAGVHLPATGLSPVAARCSLKPGALIGVSTHTSAEARFAEEFGADFITFGPVFPTPSKEPYGPPPGIEGLRAVCTAVRLPVFALGGVTPERVGDCLAAGAWGVAAISAVLAAEDIAAAVSAFKDALGYT